MNPRKMPGFLRCRSGDPGRAVDGIELSDDPILRYRPAAYSESVDRRLSRGS